MRSEEIGVFQNKFDSNFGRFEKTLKFFSESEEDLICLKL